MAAQVPIVDWSPLGRLGQVYGDAKLKAGRQTLLSQLGQGGNSNQIAQGLYAVGDLEGGMGFAKLAQQQAEANRPKYDFQTVGETLVKINERSGEAEIVPGISARKPSDPNFATDPYGRLFDRKTGEYKDSLSGGPDASESSPGVSRNMEAERYESRDIGKARAKLYGDYTEAGRLARTSRSNLKIISGLNERAQTGAFADQVLTGKKALNLFGLSPADIGLQDNVAASEALRAMATSESLNLVERTKGAISNYEQQLFTQSVPSLQNSREGNRVIIDVLDTIAQRQVSISDAATNYRKQYGTLDEGFAAIVDQIQLDNPLPLPGAQPNQNTVAGQRPAPAAQPAPNGVTRFLRGPDGRIQRAQ